MLLACIGARGMQNNNECYLLLNLKHICYYYNINPMINVIS